MVTQEITSQIIWEILGTVLDPEVPVVSVVDLGIVRDVRFEDDVWKVDICPTYSGCPALDVIAMDIKIALGSNEIVNHQVSYVLDHPWTTDWITPEGRTKLKEYGIAPPVGSPDKAGMRIEDRIIACPQCNSENTELISVFGSTACKSLFKCKDCLEPFDYFKCK